MEHIVVRHRTSAKAIEESARRCLEAINGLEPMPKEWPGRRALAEVSLGYITCLVSACYVAHWLGISNGGFDLPIRVASVAIPIAIFFLSSIAMSWFIDHLTEGGCARFTPIKDGKRKAIPRCVCAHAEPCGWTGVDLQLHVTTYTCRGLWNHAHIIHSHLPLDGYIDANHSDPAIMLEIRSMLEAEGITHHKKNV